MPTPSQKSGDDFTVVQYSRLTRRLAAVFVLALVLFHPPLMTIFGQGGQIGGYPLLFAYLFASWAAVVVGLFLAVRAVGRDGGVD